MWEKDTTSEPPKEEQELMNMKRRLFKTYWVVITVALLQLAAISSAQAVSFWNYGTDIPFHTPGYEITGQIVQTINGRQRVCYDLWVGTVEAPGLGKAYLESHTMSDGGLAFKGDAGYKTFSGRLTLHPCSACTLPAGEWSVLFVNGVPYLNHRLSAQEAWVWEPTVNVEVYKSAFSVPVRDQFGQPVVGAVFHLEYGTRNGGLGEETITTDANGMLRFSTQMDAQRYQELTQVSAPAGYRKMDASMYNIEIAPTGGFRVMADNEIETIQYVDVIINKTADGKPVVTQTPPKTGDNSHPMLYAILLAASGIVLLAFRKKTWGCKKA